ncbi:hypothetical protein THAOC_01263, partial [Thalassiosira oceanica]
MSGDRTGREPESALDALPDWEAVGSGGNVHGCGGMVAQWQQWSAVAAMAGGRAPKTTGSFVWSGILRDTCLAYSFLAENMSSIIELLDRGKKPGGLLFSRGHGLTPALEDGRRAPGHHPARRRIHLVNGKVASKSGDRRQWGWTASVPQRAEQAKLRWGMRECHGDWDSAAHESFLSVMAPCWFQACCRASLARTARGPLGRGGRLRRKMGGAFGNAPRIISNLGPKKKGHSLELGGSSDPRGHSAPKTVLCQLVARPTCTQIIRVSEDNYGRPTRPQ